MEKLGQSYWILAVDMHQLSKVITCIVVYLPRSLSDIPTGTSPPKYLPFHRPWEKSLFLQHRRNELKEVLETLDFYSPV